MDSVTGKEVDSSNFDKENPIPTSLGGKEDEAEATPAATEAPAAETPAAEVPAAEATPAAASE